MPCIMQRIKKPTTHKGKKAIINKEPKLIENAKQTLFIQGRKMGETVTGCFKDLFQLKKPDATVFNRKNDIVPFEDISPIESFSKKHNASLFVFGSHSKKRPNNIVFGRLYDHQLLDMVELGVEQYRPLSAFRTEKVSTGLKPCLLFSGPLFSQSPDLRRLQNLLVDFFQRDKVDAVRLQGLEHVLVFTAPAEDTLLMRSYRILLKKSGTTTPRVELEEIGPSMDFKIRRSKLASDDLWKLACRQPKEIKEGKTKNISRDTFGSKLGRVHMTRQSVGKLQTRKMKGLKKTPAEKSAMRKRKSLNAQNGDKQVKRRKVAESE